MNLLKKYTIYFFLGNYFYGVCAVALSIEAALQQYFTPAPWYYYTLVFCLTTWFYTCAYINESQKDHTNNRRSIWYARHRKTVKKSQLLLLCIIGITSIYIAIKFHSKLIHQNPGHYIIIGLFPAMALLYYHKYNLRNIGWLKPFVIGWIWAGLCTIYPLYFRQLIQNTSFQMSSISIVLFIKNFMFVSVLCIMFDIKDYAMDYNQQLKTFVVKNGLRKTLFFILIPLLLTGLGSFLLYGWYSQFSGMRILINTIPFFASIGLAYSLQKRKSILYYLVLIDGIMLLKAISGSIGVLYF